MKASSVSTVDQFIAKAPAEARPTIEQFRMIMKQALPDAEETISYGKPFFKYHGYVACVTIYAKWLGVEIFDGLSDADREELESLGYQCGSKTFRVAYGQEYPVAVLARLVQAQAKRNQAKN